MRIIIVGAGPAGLMLAHTLEQAGLHDFVLLEKRPEIVIPQGNTLGVWPHSIRILDQCGLLDETKKINDNMRRTLFLAPNGDVLQTNDMYDIVEANFGHRMHMVGRKEFVKMLYENLPKRADRLFTSKHIVSIQQDDKGVKITCSDQTTYEGDVLIGADGVRSVVRQQLFNEDKDIMPFTSTFKCVYGLGPTLPGMQEGDMINTHGYGHSTLVFVGKEVMYWFIFIQRDQPTQKWTRYTDEDAQEALKKLADVPVCPGGAVRVSDLQKSADYAKLVDLEEGMIPKWYHGRVGLIGDAAHKMTPHVALGVNNGIESAAVLTNRLRELDENPSTEAIAKVFETYQTERYGRAKLCIDTAGLICRRLVWPSWFIETMSRYVLPWLGGKVPAKVMEPIMRDGPVLNFTEERHYKSGNVPWKFSGPDADVKTN